MLSEMLAFWQWGLFPIRVHAHYWILILSLMPFTESGERGGVIFAVQSAPRC